MACKKCDCEYKLYIQNIQHRSEMQNLADELMRIRREFAWLEYTLTGKEDVMKRYEMLYGNRSVLKWVF